MARRLCFGTDDKKVQSVCLEEDSQMVTGLSWCRLSNYLEYTWGQRWVFSFSLSENTASVRIWGLFMYPVDTGALRVSGLYRPSSHSL